MPLLEQRRQQLDNIVKQMIANKESDSNIQWVVNDFVNKYKNELVVTNQSNEKKPNYFQRVLQGWTEGAKNIVSGIQESAEDVQAGIEKGGSVGGIQADIGAIRGGLRTVGEVAKQAFTPIVEAPGIKQGLEVIGTGISKIPGVDWIAEKVNEFAETNPKLAKDLQNVIDIALLGAGKTVEKPAQQAIGKTSGKIATKLEEKVVNQSYQEALNIIKPTLSKAEKEAALSVGRGVVKNKILPRIYETITLAPSKTEQAIAKVVQGVVSKSKNAIDNISAIRNKISELANKVETGLKNNNTIFNNNQIKSALNSVKEESKIVFGSDKTLQNSYNAVIDEMMKQLGKTKNDLGGLLKARQNFDKVIQQKFPKLFDNLAGDSVKANAVLDVRRAVNDFIATKLPEGNIYKNLLKEESLMYQGIKNISNKTASLVDTSAVKKAMAVLRQNPLTSFATGGILTFGAMSGLLTNPVVLGGLVLGGSVKLGKTVITSKLLKQELIKVLKVLEKSGQKEGVNAIQAIVDILPAGISELKDK